MRVAFLYYYNHFFSPYNCLSVYFSADKCGAEEIWLNCRDTRSLAAGTTDAVKLSRFFDCVIEKRESIGTATHSVGSSATDRRRPVSSQPTSPEFSIYNKMGTDSVVPLLETSDLK